MTDKYHNHKLIYDIIDQGVYIRGMTVQFSKLIDEKYDTPNSLQAMLGMIYRYQGKTQRELAQIYNTDEKNLIKNVTRLEKRGLVIKKADGRKKRLYLTEVGEKANDHFMNERGKLIDHIIHTLNNEDLEITRKTMFAISDIIADYVKSYPDDN